MVEDCSTLRAWLGGLNDEDGTLAPRVAEAANSFLAANEQQLKVDSLAESALSLAQEHLERSPTLPQSGLGQL